MIRTWSRNLLFAAKEPCLDTADVVWREDCTCSPANDVDAGEKSMNSCTPKPKDTYWKAPSASKGPRELFSVLAGTCAAVHCHTDSGKKTLQVSRHITSLKFFLFWHFLHLQQGSRPTLILLQTQPQIESRGTQPCQLWEGLMMELPGASPPQFIPTCPSGNRRAHLLA